MNKNPSDLAIYTRLLKYVIPFWPLFVLSVLGFSFYSGVQVMLADMMQLIVDYIGDNVQPGEGGVTANRKGKYELSSGWAWIWMSVA